MLIEKLSLERFKFTDLASLHCPIRNAQKMLSLFSSSCSEKGFNFLCLISILFGSLSNLNATPDDDSVFEDIELGETRKPENRGLAEGAKLPQGPKKYDTKQKQEEAHASSKNSSSELSGCRIFKISPHQAALITSDLLSITASTLYVCTYPVNALHVSQKGSYFYAANFVMDDLLDLPNQWSELDEGPHPQLNKALFAFGQAAEIANVTGFGLLAATDQIKIGSCLVAAGLSSRVLVGFYRLATHGFESVYGNDQDLRNFVQRMLLENIGGTVGSIVLAVSSFLLNYQMDYAGTMIIGITVGLGSTCVLIENLSNVYSEAK